MQSSIIKRDIVLLNKDFIKELDEESLNDLKEILDFDIDRGRIALSSHRKNGKVQCVKIFTKSAIKTIFNAPYSYALNKFMLNRLTDHPSYTQYSHTKLFETKKLLECEGAYEKLIGRVKMEIEKW